MGAGKVWQKEMNPVRTLLASGIPLVAVSFRDDDSGWSAEAAARAGVDIAELRIDQFSRTDVDHVRAVLSRFRELPVLATIRSAREGGDWGGTDALRRDLFRAVLPEVDAVDVELSSAEILPDVVTAAQQHDKVVIVSYHNFDATPDREELEAVVRAAKESGADYVKVSTMARSAADLKVLAGLTLEFADQGMIVIAMGELGTVSRVFFPALGSRLTYSFMGNRTAPGQLDFTETSQLLRRFYPDYRRKERAPGDA